jgi:hypothetical protein
MAYRRLPRSILKEAGKQRLMFIIAHGSLEESTKVSKSSVVIAAPEIMTVGPTHFAQ